MGGIVGWSRQHVTVAVVAAAVVAVGLVGDPSLVAKRPQWALVGRVVWLLVSQSFPLLLLCVVRRRIRRRIGHMRRRWHGSSLGIEAMSWLLGTVVGVHICARYFGTRGCREGRDEQNVELERREAHRIVAVQRRILLLLVVCGRSWRVVAAKMSAADLASCDFDKAALLDKTAAPWA